MHTRFGLTLIVNHACNLRCTYCYTGEKLGRSMPLETGRNAIDRAARSVTERGTLELGFFGGEPLIEAELILELVAYARRVAARRKLDLILCMTTNGTLDSRAAWKVMLLPEMELAISHDGLPGVHDRHRLSSDGRPSSYQVERTIGRLVAAQQEFRVVMVVRPDNVEHLTSGAEYLYERGVRRFDPSLDLWTRWTCAEGERLKSAIRQMADFWAERLPECAVSWFDAKAVRLARVAVQESARCGFGFGEIAVTPAGNLFPCERLVGADGPANPMRLPGDVFTGEDFLSYQSAAGSAAAECAECAVRPLCSSDCRCSNYVRTGDVGRPDRLLCIWDQACLQETARVCQSRMALSL
jgi:uncharacterized protein